jgi:hypothetical protein
LNPLYQFDEEDQRINVEDVLRFQPHLERNELLQAQCDYTSDDDSVEDFETVSNKT